MLHPRAGVIIHPYLPKTTARHHTLLKQPQDKEHFIIELLDFGII